MSMHPQGSGSPERFFKGLVGQPEDEASFGIAKTLEKALEGEPQVRGTSLQDHVPSFLRNASLRLLMFGGKGGTGKTTSSAATALWLARRYPEKRILVASSDPAHSLGDSFDVPLDGLVSPVQGADNLWAIELNAAALLERFQQKHRSALRRLQVMAFASDQIDVRDFLTFKLPGMEEMMIWLEIVRLLTFGIFRPFEWDLVILDTAPTGHTVRLLETPDKMLKWLELFTLSFARYRSVSQGVSALGFNIPGQGRPTKGVELFLEALTKDLETIRGLLRDPKVCEFVPVTIPEALSILETERLLMTLEETGIPVRNVIVNRIQDEQVCPFCATRGSGQAEGLREIEEKCSAYHRITVPLMPSEVRGAGPLLQYADCLLGTASPGCRASEQTAALEACTDTGVEVVGPPGLLGGLCDEPLKFVIFGGKGGVGKTTVSAATALALARRHRDKKVLVFSTDPAHSLADSFSCSIGDRVTQIQGEDNLDALEIDGARLYEEFRRDYKVTVEGAFKEWQERNVVGGRKWRMDFDQKVMVGFVDAYPPGLEEVLALEQIMRFVEQQAYDLYVFDTAPTGHLIELLKVPELVREWLRVTYRALLTYHRESPVESLERIGQRIVRSQTVVNTMRGMLADPQQSAFAAVTIPEAMGLLETEDLLASLKGLGIPCSHVIVNMLIPPTQCRFCSAKRDEQERYLEEVRNTSAYARCVVVPVPLFPHPIQGIEALGQLARVLYEPR